MSDYKYTSDSGKFDFVGKLGIFGGISLVLTIASLIYLGIHGITYGIDFSGGTEFQVKFAQETKIDQLREVVNKQGITKAEIQTFEENEFVVRLQTPEAPTEKEQNEIQNQVVEKLKTAISTELASSGPDVRRVDTVGPQVGSQLKRSSFLAVFYSLLVILIYVGLRFDYKYAPGAVICLFHDAVITLAIFELTGREINVPILAAILTLIGYSLNDTIVVFDRIRETEAEHSKRGMGFVINKAINDMLGRTMITSGTTLVSALCLFLFAGGTVSDIAFAIFLGVLFGTYSSIYVAAPFVLVIDRLKAYKAAKA